MEASLESEGRLVQLPDPGPRAHPLDGERELGGDLLVLREHFINISPTPLLTLALCIVNKSSPRLSTCSCEIKEITLKEMETGFLEENLYTKTPWLG